MTRKLFLAGLLALSAGACAYDPTPAERIHIVDSPVDTVSCRRLGTVSGTTPTGPSFAPKLEIMLEQTAALGGTDLYLPRRGGRDWSYVGGIAYRCSGRPDVPVIRKDTTVVRARG
jgi:hypothetical protein